MKIKMQNKTAYTAIEEMGKINMKTYGMERPYPTSAGMFEFKNQRFWEKNARGKREISCKRSELEAHAVNFIRNRCVGLRFKKDDRHINLKDSDGKSLKPNQIPYNMEMDIDRRCLEVAIHRFLESGVAKDAFDIKVKAYDESYMDELEITTADDLYKNENEGFVLISYCNKNKKLFSVM